MQDTSVRPLALIGRIGDVRHSLERADAKVNQGHTPHRWNATATDTDYGLLTGSAFMIGRFLTSMHWGIVADKYGRKPVMICGVLSV